MKNIIKGENASSRKQGFTMVETLVVIAITVILLLLSVVGIVQYLKTMHQLEMDGAAKEIFVAAQNHLSMAESQGYLEREGVGKEDTSSKWKGDDVYYFVVDGENSTELTDPDSYLNLMLPYGAIDEEIRTAGSYVVLYQKDTARVVEVYYAKQSGRYSHTFSDTEQEYTAMVDNFGADGEGTQHKKDRRSYGERIQDFIAGVDNDNAIIGYYGGEIAGLTQGDELYAPSIEVINEDQLLVVINDKVNDGKTHSLKLILHGEKSKVDKEVIVSLESGLSGISQVGLNVSQQGDGRYGVVLDDITSDANHFYKLFCSGEKGMIPGENITVQAVAYSNTTLTNIAYSSSAKTNSIFADLAPTGTLETPAPAGSEDPVITDVTNTVRVAYTRHLENLATGVSGFAVGSLNVTGVEQVKDISFCGEGSPYGDPGFKKNIGGSDFNITKLDGTKETKNCFMPVVYGTGKEALNYDGKNHKITGIEVNTEGDAGVFACLYNGSKVSSLELVNLDIKSTGANAGALAGVITKSEVYGVLAHNGLKTARTNETTLEISGTKNVGGLVGEAAEGSKINLSAAAVYVRGGSGATPSGDNVGGLIGSLSGSVITNSYSGGHTDNAVYSDDTSNTEPGHVNVIGGSGSFVGGLVGVSKSSSTIEDSYSTCSVKGSTPSGFVGKTEGGSIKDCYATGQVQSNTAAAATQAFAGVISGTNLSGNYYLLNVSEKDNTNAVSGITGVSGNDAAAAIVVDEDHRATAQAYDPALIITYGGKYYFPTIEMKNGAAVASATGVAKSLAKYHYGDWEIPEVQDLDFDLFNRDKLYLELYSDPAKGEINTITLAVKGNASGKTEAYVINLSNGTIEKHYLINGNSVTEPASPAHYNFQISKSVVDDASSERNGFDMYTVVLDDITTQYSHFNELFPNLRPGENISVFVAGGSLDTTEIGLKIGDASNLKNGNSLFLDCTNGQIGDANIFYIRHLQNLDPQISNVDNGVTKAYLKKDLNWTAPAEGKGFIAWNDNNVKIWNKNSTASVADTFYGIYNNKLTLFDGNNCTLQNFVIKGASSSISSEGKDNAGLFRLVNNGMKFANTRMDNCKISSAAASAGSVAGCVEGKGMTVEKILVTGSEAVTSAAVGSFGSGGVIGSYNTADTTGSLVITDTAASVKVNSANNAGGIIGLKVNGSASITDSYVGGHTVNGIYETDDAAKYNVVATGSANSFAGGIVGCVSGTGLTISDCGSAASIAVTNPASGDSGSYAGGVIGKAGAAVTINNTYTVAPVYDADYTAPAPEEGEADEEAEEAEEDTHVAAAGAFVGYLGGTLNGSGQYYLLDSYSEHGYLEYDDISVKAVGSGTAASVEPVKYFTESGINPIAGINSTDKFAEETNVYDSYLANRDYPFLISAELPQFGAAGASDAVRAYFGDWEPCQKAESEIEYHVEFYYEDPETNVVYKVPTVSGAPGEDVPDLSIQGLVTNEENKVITPATELVPGWEVTSWVITSETNPSLNITLEATKEGMLTLAQDYCVSDLKATAQYSRVEGETIIQFMWVNEKMEVNRLADNDAVKTGESLKDLYLPEKDKTIERYTFDGWYTDKELTTPADFSSLAATGEYMTFYAKYLPMEYYNVTVDFFYQIGSGATQRLDTTNLYSLKGEQSQYVLETLRGKALDTTVEIPGLVGQDFKDYIEVIVTSYDEDGEIIGDPTEIEGFGALISKSDDNKTLHITTDETKKTRFAVVFKIHSAATYTYKVIYRFSNSAKSGTASLNDESAEADVTAFKEELGFSRDNTFSYTLKNSHPAEGFGDEVFTYEKGLTPSISSLSKDFGEGFKLKTRKVKLVENPSYTEGSSTEAEFICYIDYERLKYNFTFDCKSGTYIAPVQLFYQEPLSDALNGKTTTRNGYNFSKWIIHSKGAEELADGYYINGQKENYSASDKMPAKNMVASAVWTPKTDTPFRVAFWYENAEGTTNVHTHGPDCFGLENTDPFEVRKQTKTNYYFTYTYSKDYEVTCTNNTIKHGSGMLAWYETDEYNGTWVAKDDSSIKGTCSRTDVYSYSKNGYEFTKTGSQWYIRGEDWEKPIAISEPTKRSKNSDYYKVTFTRTVKETQNVTKTINIYRNKKSEDWKSADSDYTLTKFWGNYYASPKNNSDDYHEVTLSYADKNSLTGTATFETGETKVVTVEKDFEVDYISRTSSYSDWTSSDTTFRKESDGKYYVTKNGSTTVKIEISDENKKDGTVVSFTTTNPDYIREEGRSTGQCRYQNGKWYVYKNGSNDAEITSKVEETGGILYFFNDKEVTISSPNQKNTVVGTWTYADGTAGGGNCMLLDGSWYPYSGPVDDYGYAVCQIEAEAGDDGYSYMGSVTRTGTTGSSVSASTYQNENFTGRDASHFTYKDADSDHDVIIEADGSTVVNVRFSRNVYTLTFKADNKTVKTIQAKYNADIKDYFPIRDESGTEYNYNWKASTYYSNYMQALDRMPPANILFTNYQSSGTGKSIDYYIEVTDDHKDDPGVISRTCNRVTKYFALYKQVKHGLGTSWHLTRDEEFHTIDGFSRWAYYEGQSSEATALKADSSSTTSYDIKTTNEFFYTRDSYNLEFYVDGITEAISNETVKYEAEIDDIIPDTASIPKPEGISGDDYTFEGWFKDPDCTSKINIDNFTMPLGNTLLYGRWVAPTKTVRFFLDKPEGEDATSFAVHQLEKGQTLDGKITDASGDYLSAYKPERDAKEFIGWFYEDSSGAEHEYNVAQAITEDMNVYAKWEDLEEEITLGDDTLITLRCVYQHEEDGEVYENVFFTDSFEKQINTFVMMKANGVSGYYPVGYIEGEYDTTKLLTAEDYDEPFSVFYHKVSAEPADNVVTFFYQPVTAWEYNVEYYVVYNSAPEASEVSDVTIGTETATFETEKTAYLVKKETKNDVRSQYHLAVFAPPEGYEGYHLDHYEYGDVTNGAGTHVLIHPDENGEATIKYYMTPDMDLINAESRYWVYNGESAAVSTELKETEVLDRITLGVYDVYNYVDSEGKPVNSENIINAGAYNMIGYVVYKVEGQADGDDVAKTRYFLIKKTVNDSLQLHIAKKEIVYESASRTFNYDGNMHYAHEVTLKDIDGNSTTLVQRKDGQYDTINAVFAADSFVVGRGASVENKFIIEPGDELTNLDNYLITTKFGKLRILD